MKTPAHITCYRIITSLYPAEFKSTYKSEMQALFEDRFLEDGPAKTWLIIFRELPASLWREYTPIAERNLMFSSREISNIILISSAIIVAGIIAMNLADYSWGKLMMASGHQANISMLLAIIPGVLISPVVIVLEFIAGMLLARNNGPHFWRNTAIIALLSIIPAMIIFGINGFYVDFPYNISQSEVSHRYWSMQPAFFLLNFCIIVVGAVCGQRLFKRLA
jgi:hypothetical protein